MLVVSASGHLRGKQAVLRTFRLWRYHDVLWLEMRVSLPQDPRNLDAPAPLIRLGSHTCQWLMTFHGISRRLKLSSPVSSRIDTGIDEVLARQPQESDASSRLALGNFFSRIVRAKNFNGTNDVDDGLPRGFSWLCQGDRLGLQMSLHATSTIKMQVFFAVNRSRHSSWLMCGVSMLEIVLSGYASKSSHNSASASDQSRTNLQDRTSRHCHIHWWTASSDRDALKICHDR